MTAEQYVVKITKKVMCGNRKRKDIQMQLLTEIKERMSEGEHFDSVIAQMGTVREVADSFNENISDAEKKRYKRNKILKIVLPVFILVALLAFLLYWFVPKTRPIDASGLFSKTDVESALFQTIDWLDKGEYEELRNNATTKMAAVLETQTMENAKTNLCENWGKQIRVGTVYLQEVVQFNQHYAVCQTTVTYENVSVIYTITFNETMNLAGLYMK